MAKRRAWFNAHPDLDPERLAFIDETSASTKMARLRGQAKRGQRCRAPVPHGHWKTTTFTGVLRLSGMTAPMVLDGPMRRAAFAAYINQVLEPTRRPGDIVIAASTAYGAPSGPHSPQVTPAQEAPALVPVQAAPQLPGQPP